MTGKLVEFREVSWGTYRVIRDRRWVALDGRHRVQIVKVRNAHGSQAPIDQEPSDVRCTMLTVVVDSGTSEVAVISTAEETDDQEADS